jgi:hypothetical protein
LQIWKTYMIMWSLFSIIYNRCYNIRYLLCEGWTVNLIRRGFTLFSYVALGFCLMKNISFLSATTEEENELDHIN